MKTCLEIHRFSRRQRARQEGKVSFDFWTDKLDILYLSTLSLFLPNRFLGLFFKCARIGEKGLSFTSSVVSRRRMLIFLTVSSRPSRLSPSGERLSPYVSLCCIIMAVYIFV